MKLTFITDCGRRRLLLFFAGWAMDERPFIGLARDDYDFAVAYDYASDSAVPDLSRYEEVMVIAWSFGVIAADRFMAENPHLMFTLRCAVNGTLYPVDDQRGIPETIFQGTLEGLNEQSLARFQRRMAGGASACRQFLEHAPQRQFESLGPELKYIASLMAAHSNWDMAYVADADRIIPPDNQRRAWEEEGVECRLIQGAHLPAFQSIIAALVKDKTLVARRFSRAEETYEKNAHVQQRVAVRLSEMWREAAAGSRIDRMIEIGPGTGFFTRAYSEWLVPPELELWDLLPIADTLPGVHRIVDGETAIAVCREESADAVACASVIQWFNSPRAFLGRVASVLRQDGWFVMATYGPENFHEIVCAGYPSMDWWLSQLEKDFEVMAVDERLITEHFDTPRGLLRHLQQTGVNALKQAGSPEQAVRRILASGVCELTYHPLLIVCRRRRR